MDWMQMLLALAPTLVSSIGQTGTTAAGQPGAFAGSPSGGSGISSGLAALLPLLKQILPLLSSYSAGQYGTTELNNLQNLFGQQQRAASVAFNPTAMAARTVAGTVPINRELAYTVGQAADAATAGNGMSQSPGAVASGRAAALAPFAEQNLELGQQNAQVGLPYQFATQNPDYLSILRQLQQFGSSSTFSLPQGAPGATP